MSNEVVLPALDRRSPFFVNVPSHEAKPISHLISYFKLWKQFIASLIAYLKDLHMAKEFDSNLNLQLIGSIQFPGFRDLPYKCLSSLEQQLPSPNSSQVSTPKGEPNKSLGSQATSNDAMRPTLPKTKSASSFLKNQTFAHRKSNSFTSLKSELSGTPAQQNRSLNLQKSSAMSKLPNAALSASILAAKFAPKSDVLIDPTYFPQDSLFSNMGSSLINNHYNAYQAQMKLCREISHKLLPKLESLYKNLGIKIKEIKSSLKNEAFANPTLIKEISKTGVCLNSFVSSVSRYSAQKPIVRQNDGGEDEDEGSLSDPFLVKLRLDYQLKNQLIHENYIFALYINLQTILKDLLNYVVKDLNAVTDRLIRSFNAEAVYATSLENCLFNLGVTLKDKLKSLEYDWQYFMVHNPNFLNHYYDEKDFPKREIRSFKDVTIPYANSIHSKCLRCGYMFKKQKLLKSYVSYFYLLTCNYLHEFKIEDKQLKMESQSSPSIKSKTKGKVGGVIDHDDCPVKSYNLNDYSIQVKNDKDFKFILTKTSNSGQKFTFKCINEKDYLAWSSDLHDLLKFSSNHLKRFKFIESKMASRENNVDKVKVSSGQSIDATRENLEKTKLELSKLLLDKVSLNKIQSQSLNGIFTPKVQSPSEHGANPFEGEFVATPDEMAVKSDGLSSPMSDAGLESSQVRSPGSVISPTLSNSEHQAEHESYLKLQNEIMFQQQQLLSLDGNLERPPLSRNSSAESVISTMEQNNQSIKNFLNRNQGLVHQLGENGPSSESLVPTVFVSSHEGE